MASPSISKVTFKAAGAVERQSGLLGWVSFHLGALVLDGVTARRTREGRLTLSFPARRDREGRQHAFVRPVDDEAREAIEREVLRAIGLEGVR